MIKSNASKDRESSPFFIENRDICEFWENYISEKGGKSSGEYTAWALSFNGKFTTQYQWVIKLKKATFSNGGLLISADKNIFKQTTFITDNTDRFSQDFIIRKSNWLDILRSKINPLKLWKSYVVIGTENQDNLKELTSALSDLFSNKKVKSVSYSKTDKQLEIHIHQLVTDKRIIDQIVNFTSKK
ncbi:MAG: hypothetical protein JKY53_06905 [Flavobacteriales bacterium]|nr:hypothetical protein [Flavobacteriales bacterium]